jgi:hypothetical protein
MPVDLKKIRKRAKEYKEEQQQFKAFIITDNGNDAIFNLGGKLSDWKGTLISKMVRDHDGRKVLRFAMNLDSVDDEVKELIQLKMDEVYL